MSCWYHFAIHSHLLHNLRGFSSKQQGLHLKQPTYRFSLSTWRHSISPNFFYKPNTERKPKTYPYKSPYRNDKNTLLPFTKAIMLPEYAILPQRWASLPQQLTTISGGMTIFRAIANMAHTFFLTLQTKAVACLLLLCEKIDYNRVLFLISPLLFAKRSPFFGKSRLVFPPSSRASFFSFPSAEGDGTLPCSIARFSTAGTRPSPFDHHLPTRALDFPRPFHLLHKTKQQQLIRR